MAKTVTVTLLALSFLADEDLIRKVTPNVKAAKAAAKLVEIPYKGSATEMRKALSARAGYLMDEGVTHVPQDRGLTSTEEALFGDFTETVTRQVEESAPEKALTVEELQAKLAEMTAKVAELSTKGKKAPRTKKEPKPLFVEQQREPFALPGAEEVQGMSYMGRMNLLLDCAEVLGCGEKLVDTLETHFQRAIEKQLGGKFFHGILMANSIVTFLKDDGFDFKSLADEDQVEELIKVTRARMQMRKREEAEAQKLVDAEAKVEAATRRGEAAANR